MESMVIFVFAHTSNLRHGSKSPLSNFIIFPKVTVVKICGGSTEVCAMRRPCAWVWLQVRKTPGRCRQPAQNLRARSSSLASHAKTAHSADRQPQVERKRTPLQR